MTSRSLDPSILLKFVLVSISTFGEMSNLAFCLTSLLLVVSTVAKPQDQIVGPSADLLVFAPIDDQIAVFETPIDPSFSVQLSQEFGASSGATLNVQFIPSESGEVLSPHCPQCLYDFSGNRLNMGFTSEHPPKCERGTLVATTIGDDVEMCCCNY